MYRFKTFISAILDANLNTVNKKLMNKSQLRQQALLQRQALTTEEIKTLGGKAIEKLIAQITWKDLSIVHVYLACPRRKEIDTWPLLTYLWAAHPHIITLTNRLVSTTLKPHMECHVIHQNTLLTPNAFGILEPLAETPTLDPARIDLMIIPLLACDLQGNRLGYGKGYYDQLLSRCAPHLQRIGINYVAPWQESIPHEDHDIRIQRLVTPFKAYAYEAA